MIRSGWLLGLVFPAVLSSSAAVALGVDGRFGAALAVGERYAAAERNPIYFVAPLSVECWVRVGSTNPDRAKSSPTIFLANEPRHSVTHWQLYAQKDTGALAVSMPGWDVPELASKRYIVDSKWHHVGFIFDGDSLRLFADGTQVASAKVKKVKPYPDTGPLTMGHFPGVETNRDLLLDEVRLSRVARPMDRVPDAPFAPDPDTIGLWHFDAPDPAHPDVYPDVSLTRNPARLLPVEKTAPAAGGFDGTLGAKTRWSDMDYGPFFSSTLKIPAQPANVTHKAISVRLDDKHAVAFDTELLRVSAAWTGDFLKIAPFREGLGGPPDAAGTIHFSTPPVPGWSDTDGFADPRPDHLGPLPRERARFTGLYPHGRDVVLSYRVCGTDVLELNGVETIIPQSQRPADPPQQSLEVNGETITTRPPLPGVDPPARSFFTRTIELAPHERALSVLICDDPEAQATKLGVAEKGEGAQLHGKAGMVCAAIVGHFQGLEWRLAAGKKLALRFPPSAQRQRVKLVVFRREPEQPLAVARFAPPADLTALTQGGPPRYPEPVVTKGTLGTAEGPYVVDTLTAPADNPWKSFLRFGGVDFFSSGAAAVCSVSGDVWVVGGIDDKLESLKWRRFATGLFQPLGLRIVDDKVYVLGRDQITRLHDLNADGEADFYENFNNDAKVTTNGHAYVTCLETDPAGNFYYLKCSDNTEHGGTVLRVNKDGSKLDVFATGVRNPNGMGVSPTGVVTEADNQGEWVPASRLDVVSHGEFLGFQPMSKQKPPPTDPGKPLCWMPQNVDNSSGGQTWVAGGKWGPFDGAMLHTSYGAAALLLVLQEKVDGHDQGGVVRFPLNFDSGIMRARFRPADGQLYLCGLRGWQTSGVKDATVQRVRYTGKPVYMPSQLSAGKNGILLGFTCPLDKEIAADPDSYSLLRWNYKWSAEYGSRQWSVSDPKKQGYDTLNVKSAELLKDGKTVRLTVEDMRPAMQMQIGYDLESTDGTQVRGEIYNTIHVLRE